ncbi:detergent-resistant phospholipase A [Salmonella enterica subsp. arizonae]|nr:detergent-resistant phospholipase A [Salmonella enterica subsp. arizonae]
MRAILSWLLPATLLPLAAYAQEATVKEVHDAPAVQGSIIANMLQEHDNPFTLYPYDTNYLIYTNTSDLNKEAIRTYNWSENARKDEVKFQLSLAFPLWRGILGPDSVLGASYTQKSWWQLSNSKESSPFRETNYEPQLFLVLQRIIVLPAGRCATWRWATTMTLTDDRTPPRVVGTVCIPV